MFSCFHIKLFIWSRLDWNRYFFFFFKWFFMSFSPNTRVLFRSSFIGSFVHSLSLVSGIYITSWHFLSVTFFRWKVFFNFSSFVRYSCWTNNAILQIKQIHHHINVILYKIHSFVSSRWKLCRSKWKHFAFIIQKFHTKNLLFPVEFSFFFNCMKRPFGPVRVRVRVRL